MKLSLVVEVDYEPNGMTADDLKGMLRAVADTAASEGMFTCDSPATADSWKVDVIDGCSPAAAPQLLEACKAILASFHESVRTEKAIDEFPALKAVDAAIRAAEGGGV